MGEGDEKKTAAQGKQIRAEVVNIPNRGGKLMTGEGVGSQKKTGVVQKEKEKKKKKDCERTGGVETRREENSSVGAGEGSSDNYKKRARRGRGKKKPH